jgi:5'-methylthioadenosine phosphorylase
MKIGIIGGSGLYEMDGFERLGPVGVDTVYGKPSADYENFQYGEHSIYFLSRHGVRHDIAPHMINYRANIQGFKELGVERIVSISATGGIKKEPGALILPDNAVDMTSGRISTFFDKAEVRHIDFTEPFCAEMRALLFAAAEKRGYYLANGIYICTNGPRLETAAEIKLYSQFGADIVGMTLFPECALAREAGICYANISVVTNAAAGISKQRLTTDEVVDTMQKNTGKLKEILKLFLDCLPEKTNCTCNRSLEGTEL